MDRLANPYVSRRWASIAPSPITKDDSKEGAFSEDLHNNEGACRSVFPRPESMAPSSTGEDVCDEGTLPECLNRDRDTSRDHRTSYLPDSRPRSPVFFPRRRWSHHSPRMEPSSPSPKSIAAAESPTGPYRGRNDEFPYSPLDQSRNEVRLLQLGSHAGDKDNDDVLPYCSLRVVSLDENPTYEALSYTWGDGSDLRCIILDLHLFLVTRNLELAIRQLRKRSTSDLLWVDAICINQNNDEERSQQVLKMGNIYANATRVLVWLGNHFDDSHLAFELLDHIYQRLDNKHVIECSITSGMDPQHLEALSNLFSRDYWTRVWVIQEVNFARSIRVHCGSSEIEWDKVTAVQETLREGFEELRHNVSSSQLSMPNVHQSIVFGGPQSLLIDRERNSSRVRVLELCDALLMHRLKYATDPKDKIYGLVGLTVAYYDPEYIIDYSLSVRQVYINTIEYIIRQCRRLDIICATTRGCEVTDLPTWVPNFGSTSSQRPIPFKRAWKCVYRASGQKKSNARVDLNSATMTAEGVCIGSVQAVSNASEMKDTSDYCNMGRTLHGWLTFLRKQLPSNKDLFENYARLLLLDMIDPIESDGRTTSTYLLSILGAIAGDIHSAFPDILGDPELMKLMEIPTAEDKLENWSWSICEVVFKRRLFITMDGFLGLSEESIQKGDMVCILFGCSIPVVLRKDSVCTFVSDACIVDYMYGKGVEEVEEGIRQSQMLEIK